MDKAQASGRLGSGLTRRGVLAFGGASLISPVRAQSTYPAGPVRLLVPYPAGGNTDAIARLLGAWLAERLHQPFVVENQAGAGGTLAVRAVARADPDGRTLLVCAVPQLAILPAMDVVPYDPMTSFAPISNIGSNPFVLMVHPALPARTLADFFTWVRQQSKPVPYASAGVGSLAHLSMVLLLKRAGLEMVHVPYKGDAFAMTDLMGGQVPVYFGNLSVAAPQARAGTVRALAISDLRRHPNLPEVPTVAESGYPGYRTITWNGLLAPTGTPDWLVQALAQQVQMACRDDEFRGRLANLGVDALGDAPDNFRDTIARDIKLWDGAVAIAGLSRTASSR